jgi:hypothetical protein
VNEGPMREDVSQSGRGSTLLLTVLTIVVPLVVGTGGYLLLRPCDIVAFDWFDQIGLGSALQAARDVIGPPPESLPRPALYSLPNALWSFAFVSAVAIVWRGTTSLRRAVWLAVPVVISIGAEVGQALGAVPGDFDWMDLLLIVVALSAALALWRARDEREEGVRT